MRRREFLIAASLTTAGLAIGLSGSTVSAGRDNMPLVRCTGKKIPITINYPHGGCTESSAVSFDRGPFGKDPFGIYG